LGVSQPTLNNYIKNGKALKGIWLVSYKKNA
jgi:hypothetical protein